MYVIRRKIPTADGGRYYMPGAPPSKRLYVDTFDQRHTGALFWQFRSGAFTVHATLPDREDWEVLPEEEARRLDEKAAEKEQELLRVLRAGLKAGVRYEIWQEDGSIHVRQSWGDVPVSLNMGPDLDFTLAEPPAVLAAAATCMQTEDVDLTGIYDAKIDDRRVCVEILGRQAPQSCDDKMGPVTFIVRRLDTGERLSETLPATALYPLSETMKSETYQSIGDQAKQSVKELVAQGWEKDAHYALSMYLGDLQALEERLGRKASASERSELERMIREHLAKSDNQ